MIGAIITDVSDAIELARRTIGTAFSSFLQKF